MLLIVSKAFGKDSAAVRNQAVVQEKNYVWICVLGEFYTAKMLII